VFEGREAAKAILGGLGLSAASRAA
jgi:hypothetical protein